MSEKLVQTQIREILSLLQIVRTCAISSWNNAIFLIPYAYSPTWHASQLFPFVNIAFIFPSTRRRGKKITILRNSRWSLLGYGNWSEFVSTYWILDVVQCFFFIFLLRKWKNCFPQTECHQDLFTTWYFVTNFVYYRIQVIQFNIKLLIPFIVLTGTWFHNINNLYSWCIFIVLLVRLDLSVAFVYFFNNCQFWWVIAVATPLKKKSISEPVTFIFFLYGP